MSAALAHLALVATGLALVAWLILTLLHHLQAAGLA